MRCPALRKELTAFRGHEVRSAGDGMLATFDGPARAIRCARSMREKILGAADAFYARRREGPYRFIQNRSRASVVALKGDAAAEKSKDQLSRDF